MAMTGEYRSWACHAAVTAALLLGFMLPRPASGQVDTGGIVGVITDESGAAIPGVAVTVTSAATGRARTTIASEVGRYQVTALPPAVYSVTAELQGFATIVRSQVTVNVGRTVDVNITMGIANLTETVTVASEAPLIESSKAQIASVISQEQLEALPSKSRQYLDFTLLLPATVDSVSITQQGAGFSLGGARASEAALLVDGFYNRSRSSARPTSRTRSTPTRCRRSSRRACSPAATASSSASTT